MLIGIVGTHADNGRLHLQLRKNAFKANSALWGARSMLTLRADIVHPNPSDPTRLDFASTLLYRNITRLSAHVHWPIQRVRHLGANQSPPKRPLPSPVEMGLSGSTLYEKFCSEPLPSLHNIVGAEASGCAVIKDWPVGLSKPITLCTAEVDRASVARKPEPGNNRSNFVWPVIVPSETLVYDLWLHRDLLADVESLDMDVLYGRSMGLPLLSPNEHHTKLPVPEKIHRIVDSAAAKTVEEYPRYRELIESLSSKLGYDSSALMLHRVTMKFPPTPAVLVVNIAVR
jgi:hypothetical protein